jgi:hypothetical protein
MLVSRKAISAVFVLAHAVLGWKVVSSVDRSGDKSVVSWNTLGSPIILSLLPSTLQAPARKLSGTCFVPGSMSCDDHDDKCDEINGHAYWTVTEIASEKEQGRCNTECVAESDLEFMLDKGYECGPCRICPTDHRCKVDGGDIKYSLFRWKDDGKKCEEKCEKEDKVAEKMSKDGYQCGFCPPEVKKGDKNSDLIFDPNDVPPMPDKCTLKRALHVMRYSPNWPAAARAYFEENIQVQILAHNSGTIYTYNVSDIDTTQAEFHIDNEDEFLDMYDENLDKEEQGVSFRFVSPRGEGEWNSCNYSPIAIDLNRDGKVTRIRPKDVRRKEGWTIDITGDGDEEYLNEWFGPKEGILVDLSGKYDMFEEEATKHGRRVQDLIITGVHLLGDQGGQYTDGFAKLKKRDADANGIVEAKELIGLHIWIDSNSNARLDNKELSNLADHKIVGLRVTHIGMKSTAILANGKEIMTEDLWLNR